METLIAFVPLMGLWLALQGSYVVICLAILTYRTNSIPSG
jgi:hypothetical protein